jgi:hypothetical protein
VISVSPISVSSKYTVAPEGREVICSEPDSRAEDSVLYKTRMMITNRHLSDVFGIRIPITPVAFFSNY